MDDRKPSDQSERIVARLPDGMRDRLAAIAKANKRSVNAEVVAALEGYLDLVEHGQQVAHELANDLPIPERSGSVHYLHVDAEGHVTRRTLISEMERAEGELGVRAADFRIITITPADEANDPVKAKMAAAVRRSRELVKAKGDDA